MNRLFNSIDIVSFVRMLALHVRMSSVALLCVWCVFSAGTASAAVPAHKDRSNLPITVKSNEMSADNKGKRAIFSGKVVAKQGDVTIYSDTLIVSYADIGGDVNKVEALGNVRILQSNRTGYAEQAVYDSHNGRIVLTGAPRVEQGSDRISGKVITYYLDDEKSDVSSGGDPKERVEAVINPAARKNNAGSR